MILKKSALAPFCIAAALIAGGASVAEAGWQRSSGGTGPRGNSWHSSGSGSCANGSCASSQSFTGPRGTSSRTGSTSCYGGTCNHSATVTGPYGNSVTRNSSISRY
jgi:hypothetical protein